MTAAAVRIDHLDGIRGWGSLMVLLHHLIPCMLVQPYPFLGHWSLRLVTDGKLAVYAFFVVSGYALSHVCMDADRRKLALMILSRYFRLCIPVAFSTMLAYLLMTNGLMFNATCGITQDWLNAFYCFKWSLADAVRFCLWDVFFDYSPKDSYNPVLWTMQAELIGSYVIFGWISIFRHDQAPRFVPLVVVAGVLTVANPTLACFFYGYGLAEVARLVERPATAERWPLLRPALARMSLVTLVVVMVLFTVHPPQDEPAYALAALALVAAVGFQPRAQRIMAGELSRFLGRISFPLYLVHFPIICSWAAYLVIFNGEQGNGPVVTLGSILLSTIGVCMLLASVFTHVERFAVAASKRVATWLLA